MNTIIIKIILHTYLIIKKLNYDIIRNSAVGEQLYQQLAL